MDEADFWYISSTYTIFPESKKKSPHSPPHPQSADRKHQLQLRGGSAGMASEYNTKRFVKISYKKVKCSKSETAIFYPKDYYLFCQKNYFDICIRSADIIKNALMLQFWTKMSTQHQQGDCADEPE